METIDNNNVDRLFVEDREIILLGTAHVSRESAELVKQVITEEKPDTVSVELCQSRFQAIRQKDRWRDMDIIKVIKEKKALLLFSNLLLASFQKRIAEKFDIRPGEEMIRAVETGEAEGAEIHLADRDVRVTLARTWRSLGLWDKLKMFFQLVLSIFGGLDEIEEEDIEKMKNEDILESMLADVEESFPALKRIIIDERDKYLCHKIKTAPGKKIVAVVGAGHVPGIKKYWNEDLDIGPLEKVPPPGKAAGMMKWFLPALILLLFIIGFYWGGKDRGTDMIATWLLANGSLAGIGATIALAHPLTILAAICAAPLTSLNPMMAAGWVAGLVEAVLRKPKVRDFENLSQDISSIRGFWRNKVTRILLVVVFTNLGSVAGTFVAIPLMVKSLTAVLIVLGAWAVSILIIGGLSAKKDVG